MKELIDVSNGKVTLSPLVMLVIGLGAPFVGSMVKDRLTTGENSASSQVQIQSMQTQLREHLGDSVHRNEFEDLKRLDQSRVSQAEFQMFATQVQTDLKDIKELLAEARKK